MTRLQSQRDAKCNKHNHQNRHMQSRLTRKQYGKHRWILELDTHAVCKHLCYILTISPYGFKFEPVQRVHEYLELTDRLVFQVVLDGTTKYGKYRRVVGIHWWQLRVSTFCFDHYERVIVDHFRIRRFQHYAKNLWECYLDSMQLWPQIVTVIVKWGLGSHEQERGNIIDTLVVVQQFNTIV